jgi:hypothetical protein
VATPVTRLPSFEIGDPETTRRTSTASPRAVRPTTSNEAAGISRSPRSACGNSNIAFRINDVSVK